MTLTTSKVFLLIAVILFVLVGFKVEPQALKSVDLLGFGLAFGFASFLVP